MSKDLIEAIDELVANKTFNLEALDAIKVIKDGYKALQKEHDNTKLYLEDANEDKIEYQKLLAEEKKKRVELEGIVSSQEKIVEEARKAIFDSEKNKAVADAYKDAMHIVFRPNVVRETIQRSVPVSSMSGSNGNYASYTQAYETTENITREEG